MKLEKVGDKINRGLAIVIYANPGVGKTTLAATLPVSDTLFINVEAGLGPLLGTGHTIFNLLDRNLDDLDKLYKYLRTEKHPFKYVVIDNLSELEQWILLYLTHSRNKDFTELREYGDAAFKLREYMHLFRDLTEKGITVVFNAWEQLMDIKQEAGTIITMTFPKMSRKVAPELCGIVDIVGHLEVHEKTNKRWLRIGPSDQYLTKTQFKGLDSGEPADLPALIEKIYAYEYKRKEA